MSITYLLWLIGLLINSDDSLISWPGVEPPPTWISTHSQFPTTSWYFTAQSWRTVQWVRGPHCNTFQAKKPCSPAKRATQSSKMKTVSEFSDRLHHGKSHFVPFYHEHVSVSSVHIFSMDVPNENEIFNPRACFCIYCSDPWNDSLESNTSFRLDFILLQI